MNEAAELIKFFEGCRLNAYKDSAGVWTIGYGHTTDVKPGQVIDNDLAEKFLEEDLKAAGERVFKSVKVTLNENEFAALVSQAFNLRSFEKLAAHLNKSKVLYRNKVLLYCYDVRRNKLPGLLIRRIAERLLFAGREWREIAADLQKHVRDAGYIERRIRMLFDS